MTKSEVKKLKNKTASTKEVEELNDDIERNFASFKEDPAINKISEIVKKDRKFRSKNISVRSLNISALKENNLRKGGTYKISLSKKASEHTKFRESQKLWNIIFSNFYDFSLNNYDKLRSAIYKGIYDPYRGAVWQMILNSQKLMEKELDIYQEWKTNGANNTYATQIQKDVERTYNEYSLNFMIDENRKQMLTNILQAYADVDHLGYTQGMNEVAAFILSFMPEKEAFWAFLMLMNGKIYGFRAIYMDRFPLLHYFVSIFKMQLSLRLPSLHKHFECSGYDVSIIMTKWFLCMFVQSFAFPYLIRLWDIIIFEGSYALICIALGLMIQNKVNIMKQDMDSIAMYFQTTSAMHDFKIDALINEIKKLVDEFKKNGLKSKILNKIDELLISEKADTAANVVKSFEHEIIMSTSSNKNFYDTTKEHYGTLLTDALGDTFGKNSITEFKKSNSTTQNGSTINSIKKLNAREKKDYHFKQNIEKFSLVPPPSDPPTLQTSYTTFIHSFTKFIEDSITTYKNFEYLDEKSQNLEYQHIVKIHQILTSELTAESISTLLKFYSRS